MRWRIGDPVRFTGVVALQAAVQAGDAAGVELLDEHPALAQLRLVQALPVGSTVELTTGPAKRE